MVIYDFRLLLNVLRLAVLKRLGIMLTGGRLGRVNNALAIIEKLVGLAIQSLEGLSLGCAIASIRVVMGRAVHIA